jgi:hypothetical protein
MKKLLINALKNKFKMTKEDATALSKTVEGIFNGKKKSKICQLINIQEPYFMNYKEKDYSN